MSLSRAAPSAGPRPVRRPCAGGAASEPATVAHPGQVTRISDHDRPPIDSLDMSETGMGGWGGQLRGQSFHVGDGGIF